MKGELRLYIHVLCNMNSKGIHFRQLRVKFLEFVKCL